MLLIYYFLFRTNRKRSYVSINIDQNVQFDRKHLIVDTEPKTTSSECLFRPRNPKYLIHKDTKQQILTWQMLFWHLYLKKYQKSFKYRSIISLFDWFNWLIFSVANDNEGFVNAVQLLLHPPLPLHELYTHTHLDREIKRMCDFCKRFCFSFKRIKKTEQRLFNKLNSRDGNLYMTWGFLCTHTVYFCCCFPPGLSLH